MQKASSRRDIPLDGEIYVSEVMQDEVGESFVALLANELDEGLGRQLIAQLVCRQAILGKGIVKVVGDCESK